eukprot:3793529-Pyramimonas_sp.AAC.1
MKESGRRGSGSFDVERFSRRQKPAHESSRHALQTTDCFLFGERATPEVPTPPLPPRPSVCRP